MSGTTWVIVVVDSKLLRFVSAERAAANLGLGAATAAKWKRVRRDMTAGLKRRARENVN